MSGGVLMFCPYGCGCDQDNGVVTCIRADLEVNSLPSKL